MRKLCVVVTMVLLASLSAVSVAVAQSPRAAPANDDFANARPLIPGANHTAKNIGEATVEGGEPDGGCGTINHSVWYSVTSDIELTLYVTLAGSALFYTDGGGTVDTQVAAFTGADLASLTAVECNDDGGDNSYFSEMYVLIPAGETVYIAAGSYDPDEMLSSSKLKLTTRVVNSWELVENREFETELTDDDWKLKNPTDDAIVCSDATYVADTGLCAFKFTGGTGEASSLTQKVKPADYFLTRKGSVLLEFDYRVFDASIGSFKANVSVTYTDGTPKQTATLNLAGTEVSATYAYGATFVPFVSKNVSVVTVAFKSKSMTGVILIDDIYVSYHASAISRAAGALPLPAAPKR